MKRRGGADGAPPEHLLSLPRWIAENRSPDPGPEPAWWNPDGESWRVHAARIEWSRARRAWVREHAGTMAEANRLFDPDLGYDAGPQEPDPRRAAEIERSIIEAVAVPAARRTRP